MLRGKVLANESEEKKELSSDEEDDIISSQSEKLFNLGKLYKTAKMGIDDDYTKAKYDALIEELKSEYDSIMKNETNLKISRRLMMKKLRTCFVKHPYDYIGRSIAIEVKNIFLRKVLEEHHWWHKMENIFKIPHCLKSLPGIKWILIRAPIFLACFELLYKGTVYSADLYSDGRVLYELKVDHDSFTMPEVGNLTNSSAAFQKFFQETVPEKGISGLKYPCEVLDLLEEIVNGRLTFYKTLISEIANIHFSPNKQSSHHITEVFELMEDLADMYEEVRNLYIAYDSTGFGSTPSDIPDLVSNLAEKMENSNSKLNGFFVNFFGGQDVKRLRTMLRQGSSTLNSANGKILKKPLVTDILKEGDKVYEDRLFRNFTFMEMMREFGSQMKTIWKPSNMVQFDYVPEHDVIGSRLNKTQLECRKYIVKLFELRKNNLIKQSVIQYFLKKNSVNNVDQVNKSANSKINFMTKHVMWSAWIYLSLTLHI